MISIIHIFVITVVSLALDCNSENNYIKVLKQNKQNPNEESYRIYLGTSTYVSNPVLVAGFLHINEYCIPKNMDDQYLLDMTDSYGDSWSSGSYLEIQGLYENIVFKGYLYQPKKQTLHLSLYNPIKAFSTWKFTNNAEDGWKALLFDDSNWISVTLNSSNQTNSPMYFRKGFIAVADVVSYEVRFRYRYGILAYVNGLEIYRINMPSGEISSTTYASGSYLTEEYRGIVRNMMEIIVTNSVLAVELHFLEDISTVFVSFNAWMYMYASSIVEASCYIFPYSLDISSVDGTNPEKSLDWNPNSIFQIRPWLGQNADLTYIYSNTIISQVNAVLWYTSIWSSTAVTRYRISGVKSGESGNVYTEIDTIIKQLYHDKTLSICPLYNNNESYISYRFKWIEAQNIISVPELYLGICALTKPTYLEISSTTVSVAVGIEMIEIRVTTLGIHNCTILPNLPDGVTFNSMTCSVYGVAIVILPITSFTITDLSLAISGSFSLTVTICVDSVMEVVRHYGISRSTPLETFSVIGPDESVLWSVEPNTFQVVGTTESRRFCVKGNAYKVIVGAVVEPWCENSYLNIYVILDDDKEPILRAIYDNSQLFLPMIYNFNIVPVVAARQSWFYKMGVLPVNWFDSSVDTWSLGQYGLYPNSTNQLQLYKKIFVITSLESGGAFSINLRYQYGCLIYMNGHEIFRNHITAGVVSSTTVADSLYNMISYRTITLPYRTLMSTTEQSIDYLILGDNTISIALFHTTAVPSVSCFDAVIRLFGSDSSNRVMDATFTSYGHMSQPDAAFTYHSGVFAYSPACGENWLQIQFNDDRREWISSFALQSYYVSLTRLVRSFKLQARNSYDEPWIELESYQNLQWWMTGQVKKFYIVNNKPYNIYRFVNFSSDISNCYWAVNRIDLNADKIIQSIPDLTYPSPVFAFQNIELAEIYPNGYQYADFHAVPSLPAGLSVDQPSGVIMGIPIELVNNQSIVMRARKLSGQDTSFILTITVIVCSGSFNLITATIRTDFYPVEMSYRIVRGRGMTGDIVVDVPSLGIANTLFYADLCVVAGLYTFIGMDRADSWSEPAGYCLSIDQGELRFDVNQIFAMPKPIMVTTTFSSLIPFQIKYSEWKMTTVQLQEDQKWCDIDYDDSHWNRVKAVNMGMTKETSVYIRKEFTIPSLDDYSVINVRVLFTDGLIAYLNGRRIARFNMPDTVGPDTLSLSSSSAHFARFHAILLTSGATDGINVIAFELHRSEHATTAYPVIFDASGVFGVETCSPVVDSIVSFNGTAPLSGAFEDAFDLYMLKHLMLQKEAGTYVSWEIENMEGSRFNAFAIQNVADIISGSFTIDGKYMNGEFFTMADAKFMKLSKNKREIIAVPVAVIGFKFLRFNINRDASDNFQIMSFVSLYCKASRNSCPAVPPFPAVSEGQISPSLCPENFTGFSYRNCTGNMLGEIHYENCKYKSPEELIYVTQMFTFVLNTMVTTGLPMYKNTINEFYTSEGVVLPDGLKLDKETGIISGIPTAIHEVSTYTIFGRNPSGAIATVISIAVRIGICKAVDVFPDTYVNETAVYVCSSQGSYIGRKSRVCLLGVTDGVWKKSTGMCISLMTAILLVIAMAVLAVIFIYMAVKNFAKKRPTSGVNNKTTSLGHAISV